MSDTRPHAGWTGHRKRWPIPQELTLMSDTRPRAGWTDYKKRWPILQDMILSLGEVITHE